MSELRKFRNEVRGFYFSRWFHPVMLAALLLVAASLTTSGQLQNGSGSSGGNVNVTQLSGTAASVNNGATDAGTLRVTLSNDSTGQVKLATSGNTIGAISNASFGISGSLPSGTNPLGTVRTTPFTACGTTSYDSAITSLPTTEAAATSTATCVDVIYCNNLTASAQTFSIKDNAGTPIVYVNTFSLPANSNILLTFGGIRFNAGVRWVATNSASVNCQIKGAQ